MSDLGILSIDIDGNDYWIWGKIEAVNPVIVIIEYNSLFGGTRADEEVVAYNDFEECVEQLNYLLAHDDVRRSIATAGQRRTLRDHSFDNAPRNWTG